MKISNMIKCLILIIINSIVIICDSKSISVFYDFKYLMINIPINLIEEQQNIFPFANTYL